MPGIVIAAEQQPVIINAWIRIANSGVLIFYIISSLGMLVFNLTKKLHCDVCLLRIFRVD
jgi:hypothetical protein